ncbi:pyridoxamine 5'-phosphate oxidase family protein [Halosimplex amylolyticum]|uniref:pyridoxamine 5'-phosphate oxidase family protein n=1 Tax=Halosimplex amylolyticum TaxID=3396616 RepID=UPI003F553F83
MSDADQVEMGEAKVDEFLERGGTGVLALSTVGDEWPDAVPVSYGYDPTDRVFYFRISVDRGDDPEALVDRPVTFVVYGSESDDDRWRSVVAHGRLEDADEARIGTQTLAEMERIDIPLVDVFEEPLRMVAFEFFRLDPEEVTGRIESLIND